MVSRRYQIELRPSAIRELERLDKGVQVRVARRIDDLASNPRPPGAKKLSGQENLWRLRVGDYRVIYLVQDRQLIVLVIKVAHRREAYRR